MVALLALFGVASCAMPALKRLPGNAMFYVAAAVSAAAAIWTATLAPTVLHGGAWELQIPWLPMLGLDLNFRIDALSWVLAMIVTAIGALVLIYCASYFDRDEPGLGRFAGILLGFAGVMFGLVTADNIYLMFVFWEGTSILSYLLIGHYTGRRASRAAAMQALLVTTFGGLAMLVGLVIVHSISGSANFSEIIGAGIPTSGLLITALMLILLGAMTKSALVPFHFWLPGAMAAPTPVSAYLHAASMVKAGIYLVLRLLPEFGDVPGFREVLIVAGVWTMLVGGWRSLRQFDLKLILAYGTVSQLGFMTAIAGFGGRDAGLAALAMVIGHALFKAALFLSVGIIDHRTGTRDIRKLSGLGRQAPVLATIATIAAASMAGIPPLWGFVAKEGVFSAFISAFEHGDAWGLVALIGTAMGSILTFAYTARFVHGAFAKKPGVEEVEHTKEHADELIAPGLLVVATIVFPFIASGIDQLLAAYADTMPAIDPAHPYHLAIWHGFEPALGISAITILIGLALFYFRAPIAKLQARVPDIIESSRGYWLALRVTDAVAARITASTQRGSLPMYLATTFVVFIGVVIGAFAFRGMGDPDLTIAWSWPQIAILIVIVIAAFATTRSAKRFQGVILVGITGYAQAAIFAISGAPDLATTQALIETLSLIVFVLVLRRLPARHAKLQNNIRPWVRWAIGFGVAFAIAAVVLISMGARVATPDGTSFAELALEGGHGSNIVNVTLVDIRGWDTMGELSVLIAAATGVASLVYLNARGSKHQQTTSLAPRGGFFRRPDRTTIRESIVASAKRRNRAIPRELRERDSKGAQGRSDHNVWLLAGHSLAPEHRSIVVEVVVRLLFHAMIIVSLFLLFSGHNDPGGGFAGGVVAALALAARYMAGGRHELNEAVRVDAGTLLGVGMILAAGSALVPMFFGHAPLTSFWVDQEVEWVGHVIFVTSTIFDIGVYLIVIGLAVDVLRSLGSELDIQAEEQRSGRLRVSEEVLDEAEVRGHIETAKPVTKQMQVLPKREGKEPK
ncbi:Na+/H+ antiporter subunit A [Gulosibacter molinativorax]|uniref:Na+/H+ antiporter subunit A n=1 Tax=Gulosibacter molinativorax TaxID=256821 RepID=A0ABT7C9P0_9MICO|nr:Na+/H+ antiporter subunit A [Gulosibacter molinativorax]MDJ1371934.1 Na+/H+ antiporter subunit A [Gulosibacter molinativorax]QUY62583.1 Na(+)/H(+) antiporter subunit A [Gulosibacter molinativorax]